MPAALSLIQTDLDALARRMKPSGWSGAVEGLTLALLWLGSRLGLAGNWGPGIGLLVVGAAVALLAAWRHRDSSAQYELNRQQWSGSTGCLGLLGLVVVFVAAQILSGILADAGGGLLPQIGLAVVFGLALWLGMRAWQRRTARSIADGTMLQEIRGTESPRLDPVFDDPDALRICALLVLFQDVHPDFLREVLGMDPRRFEAVLAHLDSRLMIVREDKRPGSERPGSGRRVHLSFQGEQAILHHLAHLQETAQTG